MIFFSPRVFVVKYFLFLILVMGSYHNSFFANKIFINFDYPFSKTEFQSVLEDCIWLQYEFDEALKVGTLEPYEASLLLDITIGRLFHIESCIQEMHKKKLLVYAEDVIYLRDILDFMSVSYKKLVDLGLPEKNVHVNKLLVRVKNLLRLIKIF